jgi:hypothetical protein
MALCDVLRVVELPDRPYSKRRLYATEVVPMELV